VTATQLNTTKADRADRRESHPAKRLAGKLLTALCAAALLVVVALVLVPGLLGLQRFVITGGSMTGTIPKGAIIYSKVVPATTLRVGDIITFTPPGYDEAVTHRIIGVEQAPDGQTAYRTKGDFNEIADPWNPVTLNEPRQARYVFQVPLLGYVLAALGTRSARIMLVALPAFLIALSILWSLWREAGEELVGESGESGESGDAGAAEESLDVVPHDALSRA
jgi:signal peptidase I